MARVKRRELRQERKMARIEGRQETRAARIAGKTERAGYRSATKQAAYEAGMDPNAWVGDVTDLAGDALGMFAGAKDNNKSAAGIKDPSKNGAGAGGSEKSAVGDFLDGLQAPGKQLQKNLLIGGLVLAALVVLPNLMKRKR